MSLTGLHLRAISTYFSTGIFRLSHHFLSLCFPGPKKLAHLMAFCGANRWTARVNFHAGVRRIIISLCWLVRMHRFALAIFNGPAMMAAIKTHTHTHELKTSGTRSSSSAAYIILLCAARPIMAERAVSQPHVFCFKCTSRALDESHGILIKHLSPNYPHSQTPVGT